MHPFSGKQGERMPPPTRFAFSLNTPLCDSPRNCHTHVHMQMANFGDRGPSCARAVMPYRGTGYTGGGCGVHVLCSLNDSRRVHTKCAYKSDVRCILPRIQSIYAFYFRGRNRSVWVVKASSIYFTYDLALYVQQT